MGSKTDSKRAACREVVNLFQNYHGFPDTETDQGKREVVILVDALERWTVNAEHAKAVGMKLLEEEKFCPRVVDFKDVGEELRPLFVPKVLGIACGGACIDGWIFESTEGQGKVRPCSCRPGKPVPPTSPAPKHPQAPKPMTHVGALQGSKP